MKFIRVPLILCLCVSLFIISCRKTTQIGQNVIPANDLINAVSIDTFTVLTQEEAELPVPTNNLSNYLLGSMKDNVFGTSYAAIFSQVQLQNGQNLFNDSTSVDSAVLVLPFYIPQYYGIQNIPENIKVYQVTQSMGSLSTTYYSNQTFAFNPTPIGAKTFVPNVNAYTLPQVILGDTEPAAVRIRLSNALIQEFIGQNSNGGVYASNSAFQNFFKGILIAPDTSGGFGGGIMYLDMTNANIIFYGRQYSPNSPSYNVGAVAVFPINSNSGVTTGLYKHNYTGTAIPKLLTSDSASNKVLYLQSMGGLRARITVPYLAKTLGSNVLINKAEFEVVQVQPVLNIDTNFSAPADVEIVNDSLNNDYLIEDKDNQFLNYGGGQNPVRQSNGDTTFNYVVSVADQVQYMLTGKNPTGSTINYAQFNSFFLLTSPNPEIAARIVVGGGNSKQYKLVLHLVYTKIEN